VAAAGELTVPETRRRILMDMNKIGDMANQHSDKIDDAQEQHGDKLGQHSDKINKGIDAAQDHFSKDDEQK